MAQISMRGVAQAQVIAQSMHASVRRIPNASSAVKVSKTAVFTNAKKTSVMKSRRTSTIAASANGVGLPIDLRGRS